MKLIRNFKILFVASIFALSSCTPLDTIIIDSGYYDPVYYGPGMPPPPITKPLPPAPPSGHKPAPPKPDNRPDHKPDNKPNKPGNNIKPDNKPNKPNNSPSVNPGNSGQRPSGNQPGKRPSNNRRRH